MRLCTITADRVHPGIVGAARTSSDEMDCLSCFCQILKDIACLGNRATEETKGEKNEGSKNVNAISCPAATHEADYTKWYGVTWANQM